MKQNQVEPSANLGFCRRLLWSVVFAAMSFALAHGQAETTRSFDADTQSVLRNPCVGWGIYCEGWEFENSVRGPYPQVNAENFWKQMDEVSAHKYATHIYIRILWSAMEPEEGKYAWIHNPEFIQFLEEARKRNLKLTFRVYWSTKSRSEEGTPKYVFDAGAAYCWDSGTKFGKSYRVRDAYPDHPVWLEKFEVFVKAFARRFDDPDVTDFVDGFGAGWWGEGHHNNLMDEDNLPMLIDKLTGFYYENFKNVLTVYNLADGHPDPTITSDFDLARELVYEKRGFLPRRDGLGSHWFSRGDRDAMQYYFFPNAPLIGEGCYWLSNPVAETEKKFLRDSRFKMNTWPEALAKGLDDALNFHANTFDMRVPQEARMWITEMPDQVQRFITRGGYRLLPERITFANEARVGGKIAVVHTWKNMGVGLLPNNHINWNQKYRVAFALLDPRDKRVVSRTVVEDTNPGTWIRGRYYTYRSEVDAGSEKGPLLLAVSIFDTRKNAPGLELSLQGESFGKWYPVGMVSVGAGGQDPSMASPVVSHAAAAPKSPSRNVDGAVISFDPAIPEELRIRGGLPNFFAKLKAKGVVKIAYVGGSVSDANGWRVKSLEWFRSQYPEVSFAEINAAIPGTGSDFAACRIGTDVLAQNPDLVFLEHRVDGGAGFGAQSVEGLVRQIWKHDPRTDVCFIHPVSLDMIPAMQAGESPEFGAAMERIANAYDIPSIDLGVEIARLEMAGELDVKFDLPVAGKLWFSTDGMRPGEVGQELYSKVFIRSMARMTGWAEAKDHPLPAAMNLRNWEKATVLPIAKAALSPGWRSVEFAKDPVCFEDYTRTREVLRGAVKCSQPGEEVRVKWTGTTLGFTDIPTECKVQITIDGGSPITIERKQVEKRRSAGLFYLPEQAPGEHTAVVRILELPAGGAYYMGQVLVVGTMRE